MIGFRRPERLQDLAGRPLLRVALVGRQCRGGERQRVEDHGLGVRRLSRDQIGHRPLVRHDPVGWSTRAWSANSFATAAM
jgi:hypothetical protein